MEHVCVMGMTLHNGKYWRGPILFCVMDWCSAALIFMHKDSDTHKHASVIMCTSYKVDCFVGFQLTMKIAPLENILLYIFACPPFNDPCIVLHLTTLRYWLIRSVVLFTLQFVLVIDDGVVDMNRKILLERAV